MLGSIKSAITAVVASIKSILPTILATMTATVLTAGCIYYYTIKDGIYEKSRSNVRYALEQYISEITLDSIISNGRGGYAYTTDLDELANEILKKLKDAGSNITEYTGIFKDDEVIKKLIKAEVMTLYPDLRSASEISAGKKVPDNEVQGGIKIVKSNAGVDVSNINSENILKYNFKDSQVLTYIPYSQFKTLISSNDASVNNYFSLKPSSVSSSVQANFIVKTDESNSAPILSKEQIENAINKSYTGDAKTNLLSALDSFVKIQEQYNVNAVFAIAVAQQKSSCGTVWNDIDASTYNWMHEKSSTGWIEYTSFSEATEKFGSLISGSDYYGSNKYNVSQIITTYCEATCANKINEYMAQIYDSIGIDIQLSSNATSVQLNTNTSMDIVVSTYRKENTKVETIEYIPKDDGSGDDKKENSDDKGTIYSFSEVSINYQNMLSKYSMPSGFLWSLLVMGEDVDFVIDLADLAIEETDIVIEAQDNTCVTANQNVEKYYYEKKVAASGESTPETYKAQKESSITTTITTTESNTKLNLTYAETWVAIYINEYKNTPNNSNIDNNWKDNAEWQDLENIKLGTRTKKVQETKEDGSTQEIQKTITDYKVDVKTASNVQTISSNLYCSAGTNIQERTDIDEENNFVTYFNKSKRAKENILQSPDWVYEMLESQEKTANMVNLFRYLLYKTTNQSYGVTNYDFEPYTNLVTASQSSLDQYIKFMHSWEGTPPEDGDYYIVFDDGFGNLTVGWGVCFYSTIDGYMKKEAFNAFGYDVTQLKEGDKVLKTAVDSIEDAEVQDNINRVDSITTGLNLTQYQKYALVDRMYQAGNINGFVDAYTQYWKDTDSSLGEDTSSEDYSHGLAQWFIGNTTKEGVKNRRKAQWLIFKYGYYNRINEYYTPQSYNPDFYYGISIYNADGSVSQAGIQQLEDYLTNNVLHTTIHSKNSANQNGPFETWWESPNNCLEKFQCTWWVHGRASQYLGYPYPISSDGRYGNGGEWYDRNKENGWFAYGSEPRAYSLIVWKNSSYGHVAFVEAVDTNGDIYVSEAGSGTSWYGIRKYTKSNNYAISGTPCYGFIYLDEPK